MHVALVRVRHVNSEAECCSCEFHKAPCVTKGHVQPTASQFIAQMRKARAFLTQMALQACGHYNAANVSNDHSWLVGLRLPGVLSSYGAHFKKHEADLHQKNYTRALTQGQR